VIDPLRVGLDYLPAATHPSGVGRYVRELVRALVRLEQRPALALFELGGGARPFEGEPLGLAGAAAVRRLRGPLPRRAVSALGRIGLGADRLLGGVEVFHRVHPRWPPVSRAPETLAVAELPPPGSAAERELARAARRAAAVLVFSEDYRRRVAERCALDPTTVRAVGVGCEHWARAFAARPLPPPPPRPRFLVLGALRPERRPTTVLAGFERLRAGGLDAELVFVGRAAGAADPFRRALAVSPAREAVRWLDDAREAELPELVAGCTSLVHLAEEEGSPVTPLEAFSLGLDVVAARVPSFVEVLGSEALYVDLAEALESPERLAEQMAESAGRAARPEGRAARRALAAGHTWERNALATRAIWQDVARSPSHPASTPDPRSPRR